MVDGLGVTGYEGVFIRVCEITLSVLRSHRESLMSVLETFIHDPLVEWTKLHKSSTVEVENPQVKLRPLEVKLRLPQFRMTGSDERLNQEHFTSTRLGARALRYNQYVGHIASLRCGAENSSRRVPSLFLAHACVTMLFGLQFERRTCR
jgi:hypothetical protein